MTRNVQALLALVAAILLWTWGEDLRAELPALQQQVRQALRVVERDSRQELQAAQASSRTAAAQRVALERRLASTDDEQTLRAQTVYDLRRRCAEARVVACVVRLSEAGAATGGSKDSSPRTGGTPALERLGIVKARAIVSGTFQNDEMLAMYRSLMADPDAVWRLNGVVVRNNAFELDVERHIRTTR